MVLMEILITLEILALKIAKVVEDETYDSSLDKHIMFFLELEEKNVWVVDHIVKHKRQVKKLFDKR